MGLSQPQAHSEEQIGPECRAKVEAAVKAILNINGTPATEITSLEMNVTVSPSTGHTVLVKAIIGKGNWEDLDVYIREYSDAQPENKCLIRGVLVHL